MSTTVRTVVAGMLATIALAVLAAPGLAKSPVQPYATNDAGGFLNVLPPGENGLVNAVQLAQNQASGAMLRTSTINSISIPTCCTHRRRSRRN